MFFITRIRTLEKRVTEQEKAIEKLTEKLIQFTTADIEEQKLTFWQIAKDVEKLKKIASDCYDNHSPEMTAEQLAHELQSSISNTLARTE